MMRLTFLMLLGNAIFYLIQAVSCCRILTRRFSWPVMVLGFAVGYLLFVTPAIPFPETGMIRGVIALVSFPLVDMVLFRDKWYRCLFCGVAAVLIMSAADMISAAVLLTPEQLRQGLTFQPIPVQLTSYAIFLSASAFFLWMFTLLMNRYKYRLSGREWALYLLFPVSQCLLLYGWMMLCRLDFSANRMWILLAGLITCVAADAALFTAVRGMAQRVELQAENDLLAQQIDRQKEHYAAITAQYENIRRIRHDIANHLYTMDLLLKEGRYAQAQDYFAEVSQVSRYKSDLGSCENPVEDAFLYARAEDLKAQGFDVEFRVAVPAECGIRNADMVVAFGNLLDNAAEACRNAGEKRIALSAGMEREYLHIREQNPAPVGPVSHDRRIPELERGIGHHILRELAGKYDGSFTFEAKDGEFRADLFLKERGVTA